MLAYFIFCSLFLPKCFLFAIKRHRKRSLHCHLLKCLHLIPKANVEFSNFNNLYLSPYSLVKTGRVFSGLLFGGEACITSYEHEGNYSVVVYTHTCLTSGLRAKCCVLLFRRNRIGLVTQSQ